MNNKTKKEIWDELQKYKKQVSQYEDFWEVEIIDEYKKRMRALKKSSLILLIIVAFLLGLVL